MCASALVGQILSPKRKGTLFLLFIIVSQVSRTVTDVLVDYQKIFVQLMNSTLFTEKGQRVLNGQNIIPRSLIFKNSASPKCLTFSEEGPLLHSSNVRMEDIHGLHSTPPRKT